MGGHPERSTLTPEDQKNTRISQVNSMSLSFRLAASISMAAAALTLTGCRNRIEVRTMAAPDAGLSRLHSFRMLPGPARRDGQATTGADDPMISNSIANRAIRQEIVKAFQERGYPLDERSPDFAVAFYATAREKLDVTLWDYGYPFYPRWPRYPLPPQTVTQYTEGTVVIDVVHAGTRELLWRGEGRAELSDDPAKNVEQLAKAASAIVAKFPEATRRIVASRR
jgi:hypothetical protein